MEEKKISSMDKYNLQKDYCNNNNIPMFAPYTCWRCGEVIWDYISEEKSKTEHITGCPCCRVSYCD